MKDLKLNLQTGDVILFKPDSLVGNVIAFLTSSNYSHVALVIEGNLILNCNRFTKSKIQALDYDDTIHHVYRPVDVTQEQKELIQSNSFRMEGLRYDYLQIIGLLFRVVFGWDTSSLNNLNRFICSEIIDRIFYKIGVPRLNMNHLYNVTPEELLSKYNFERIK